MAEFVVRFAKGSNEELLSEFPELYSRALNASAAIGMYKRFADDVLTVMRRYPSLAWLRGLRVSVAELEACRADPARWVRNKLSPSGGGPRLGFAGATKLAIYRYHSTGSGNAAREHLRALLTRFRSDFMKADAEANLEAYIAWCVWERPAVAVRKARLNFDLGSGVILGGEVSRVDVDIARSGEASTVTRGMCE